DVLVVELGSGSGFRVVDLAFCLACDSDEVLEAEGTNEAFEKECGGVVEPLIDAPSTSGMILEGGDEDRLEVDLGEGVVLIALSVVFDEYPPDAVGSEAEVGVETVGIEPVFDLPETML